MRRLARTTLALGAASLAIVVASAATGPIPGPSPNPIPGPSVAIFYYPWYGTPARDGGWEHWDQNGGIPPVKLPTAYYPSRGPYSSTDERVVRDQMREIAGAGIDTVIVSWWGPDSVEAARFPAVAAVAEAAGLRVAVHLEPWEGRTASSTREVIDLLHTEGIDEFYVYDSTTIADADWASALADLPPGVRVYANTWLAGKAAAGGFQGLYPYDVVVYPMSSFRRVCRMAHRLMLACLPSVGPGFDPRRATGMETRVRRQGGARYDAMWQAASVAQADVITITSYNEWLEGTQIEPARRTAGYYAYEGAWGLRGTQAERAYLVRTRYWVDRLR